MRLGFSRFLIAFSFLALVIAIPAAACAYLYKIALDQYHSNSAFSIRTGDLISPIIPTNAFTQISGPLTVDTEVLQDYILSQTIIEVLSEKYDFYEMFNRSEDDIVFALGDDATMEDLVDYWQRMVFVSADSSTGKIDLEVRAFSAQDAQSIAQDILNACAALLDELGRSSREEALKYVRADLAAAEDRLKDTRTSILEFRLEHHILDPESDVASKMGVVSALQQQLASELVDRQTIANFAGGGDSRIENIDRRIEAIRDQIAAEREDVDRQYSGERPLSAVMTDFEGLLAELHFMETGYATALETEKQMRADAELRTRYISVHVPPTLAESSLYPQRPELSVAIFIFMFAFWCVGTLVYLNATDR